MLAFSQGKIINHIYDKNRYQYFLYLRQWGRYKLRPPYSLIQISPALSRGNRNSFRKAAEKQLLHLQHLVASADRTKTRKENLEAHKQQPSFT